MNQKTDDADDGGTDRPDEHSEAPSSQPTAVGEAQNDDPGVGKANERANQTANQMADEMAGLQPRDARTDEAAATPPAPKSRGPLLVAALAGLALAIALAALAGVGYLAWQGRDIGSEQANTDARVAQLADDVEETLETLADLRGRLSTLAENDAANADEIESLERDLEDLADRYENIPPRLSSLESAMSSLQGISMGVRDSWLLAEAEYYMQIANAQLQLAGNPEVARLALQFADERVRQAGHPGLTDVRRALAGELRALEAMEKPDVEGITMELASLADSVESLPILETVTRAGGEEAAVDEEAGAFDRALGSVRRAFSDVVSVRRSDEAVRPLLSPDARYFLRTNLALQMQTARLALLRGERTVFERSLDDAERWLQQYFDTDAASVTSALRTIARIRDDYVTADPPDISRSLTLLRQYQTRTSAGRPAQTSSDAEEADDETR